MAEAVSANADEPSKKCEQNLNFTATGKQHQQLDIFLHVFIFYSCCFNKSTVDTPACRRSRKGRLIKDHPAVNQIRQRNKKLIKMNLDIKINQYPLPSNLNINQNARIMKYRKSMTHADSKWRCRLHQIVSYSIISFHIECYYRITSYDIKSH